MILSDATLKAMLASGELGIEPLHPNAIQPASVDCCLGTHFLLPRVDESTVLTLDSEVQYDTIESDEILVPGHTFLLATTIETFRIPNGITAFVEGRSSIGRMGLFIQNAGWVDSGFEGQITLELYNANAVPIRLTAGRRICQLVFCKMDRPAENPYRGKYHGQRNAVGSRIAFDVELLAAK